MFSEIILRKQRPEISLLVHSKDFTDEDSLTVKAYK